jgi:hypothetical protein
LAKFLREDTDGKEAQSTQIEQLEKACRKDEPYRLALTEMLQDLEAAAKSSA